jgi:hypothetical protein
MKRYAQLGLLLSALTVIAFPTQAGVIVNVNVDEFGNGATDYQTPLHSLPSGLTTDPSGGLGVPVLVYALPFTPTPGDVHLTEIVGSTVVDSDVIRFFSNFLIFYSDNGDGVDAPADTGFPDPLSTNVVFISEVGPEGNNGAKYTPGAGNPGFFNSDFSPTYNIISDSPEPATTSFVALGLAGLGLAKRIFKK